MANITLFAQIVRKIPREIINSIIAKYGSDKFCKGFNTWSHLITMIFCQFAYCTSLREISNGLKSATGNLNHLGLERAPSKSILSYQNEHRPCKIFKECYYALFSYLGQQAIFKGHHYPVKRPVKFLDSTVISLCLSLYDWAYYRTSKGAIKLHALLDSYKLLPEYVLISDGKLADNVAASLMQLKRNTLVVMDRAYGDFRLLYNWDSRGVFFIVRHKENLCFRSLKERELPPYKHQNILKDEEILLEKEGTFKRYPKRLRRVVSYDEKTHKAVELLTNNFDLAASTIAALYKARWQIEIFFRHLKQLLHIKTFVGTSANAVEIQIWTALITILLLFYLKQIAQYPWCLSNLVSSLRLNTFTKIDLEKWLNEPFKPPPDEVICP